MFETYDTTALVEEYRNVISETIQGHTTTEAAAAAAACVHRLALLHLAASRRSTSSGFISKGFPMAPTADDLNPALPCMYYATILPRVLKHEVMQDFYHPQQYGALPSLKGNLL